ncbi:MAG TPA: ATP-binding protein [Vicinamibacterales bacterium]|nr:ATP-binding protein [Vicinamibacterales bacterium]
MIPTLRSRLTLVYAAVFGVVLIAIGAISYNVLAYQLDADVSTNLAGLTRGLHGYLRVADGAPAVVFDPADPAQAAFVDEATRYYQLFDAASGELILRSTALAPLGLELTPAEVRQFRRRPSTFDVQTDYGRLRVSNSVIDAGGRTYLLQVGVSLEPRDAVLERFLILLAVGVPAALVAAIFVGRWAAGVALRPLSQLSAATRGIDIAGLRQRLPVRGAGDELDDVAIAFNETLSRLEHAVGEMRQFSTALAHELRTPLAALRGDIELSMLTAPADDEARRRRAGQLEEIDKLKALIERILLLARAEAGEIAIHETDVDLAALAETLVEQIEPVARAKGLTLRFERGGDVAVRGDADWLKRVVLNLLDNAIKFTGEGGAITVAVSSRDAEARLTVRDTGIGIDPADAAHVFERFFRADPARSSVVDGAGLGLSLVKWIVDRHHGRIDVETRPGEGATFTVTLPRQVK